MGIISRIGDGRHTDIWQHNWVLRSSSMRPLLCLSDQRPTRVSELINSTNASWDIPVLQRCFIHVDIHAIMSIPLCTSQASDFWGWQFEKNGIFSVRSAYHMLMQERETREDALTGRTSTSNRGLDQAGWSKLWSISVSSKIKTFLWRLGKQSLAIEDVRTHCNMSLTDNCLLCGNYDSWMHSLLDCSMSRCVCALANEDLVEAMTEVVEPSARQWMFQLKQNVSHALFVEATGTLRALWSSKRKLIHEAIQQQQTPLATHLFIQRFIRDLDIVRVQDQSSSGVEVQRTTGGRLMALK